MIHIKNGGVSSYQKLNTLNPKQGETFLSEDGSILAFVRASNWTIFLRTEDTNPVLTDSTLAAFSEHHLFKRVEVDLTVRAV